ncbi:MAG TPA: PGPGW domain-containing protein [Kribbella sp.]|nr:PGPGW domain-containing protein [Kribbella sp.]
MGEQTSPDRTDHNITLDAQDDRWEWRRKIRSSPRKHLIYRICVGVLGSLLIIAAPLTGWLPGPGGIPLFIAGLAVLASEFEWAQRLLYWVKGKVHKLTTWTGKQPGWLKFLGTVALILFVLAWIWLYLAVLSVPAWLPDSWESFLYKLPLLD